MTAVWVIAGGAAVFFALLYAYSVGHHIGEAKANRQWRRQATELDTEWRQLFKDLGVDHGHELQTVEDELAKTRQAIADLQRNIGVVWDAGVYAGQTFQADRQENGL